jgi:hypothetical protein
MTTPFGAACGSVAVAGASTHGRASARGDAVRLRGVWQIWIKNAKAKGILLAKIDPLDIRLHVDSRFKQGCDPLRVWCPVGLVHTRDNQGASFQVLDRLTGAAGIGTCQLICDTWSHEFREQAGLFLIDAECFFGGLIQAAVGNSGGFGAFPLNRIGLAANAASSVTARC